jgi:hypothetical protein
VRACSICTSAARADIDAALETDRSLRDIAAQFGVSKTALHRHWQAHVSGGQPLQPPSRTGPIATTRRSSRLWTFAKWGLGLVIGVGVLVWSAARRAGVHWR